MAGVTGSNPVAPTTPHHNPLIQNFYSLYAHEFVRVACCVPRTRVADAEFNLGQTLRLALQGDKAGAAAALTKVSGPTAELAKFWQVYANAKA